MSDYKGRMQANYPWFIVFADPDPSDPDHPWRWRLEDRSGRILATSAERWSSAAMVVSSLEEIQETAREARIFNG